MAKARRRRSAKLPLASDSELRIIGGQFRGSKLRYSGRFETRPMKERIREAIFNLVGPSVQGTHAIDLFAGTGALGLEAISRGAQSATLIERHVPTGKVIRGNAAHLGIEDRTDVVAANTFIWIRQQPELPALPWCVFCSPPYSFYQEHRDELLTLIERLLAQAPAESMFVVEADQHFDFALLPRAEQWTVRAYAPAVVGILRV